MDSLFYDVFLYFFDGFVRVALILLILVSFYLFTFGANSFHGEVVLCYFLGVSLKLCKNFVLKQVVDVIFRCGRIILYLFNSLPYFLPQYLIECHSFLLIHDVLLKIMERKDGFFSKLAKFTFKLVSSLFLLSLIKQMTFFTPKFSE